LEAALAAAQGQVQALSLEVEALQTTINGVNGLNQQLADLAGQLQAE